MKKKTLLPLEKASWLKSLFLLVCLVLSGTTVFAQEKTVTGVVTDSFNEPLIGASIVVQGTTNGVITDLDGKYSIKVTPGATLQFSYVGMEKQSIKVGNQSIINVQLKDDSQMLAETVVIGYGSAKKRDLTPISKVTRLPTNRLPIHYRLCKVKWPVYRLSTPAGQVKTLKSAYAVPTLSMVTNLCM